MSIRLMTMVWEIEFPTQSQKLIMLKLADYASDSGGSVFPANETMARKAGCDERTVQRAMKAFRDIGLVKLVRQGGGKPGTTNEWKLDVDMISALANGNAALTGDGVGLELSGEINDINTGDKMPGVRGDTRGDNLSGGVTSATETPGMVSGRGDTGVTQSVKYPSKESSRAYARASEGPRASSALKAQVVFTLTPADPSWSHWLTWLSDKGRRDLVMAADEAHRMTVVGSRFPKDNSPLPKIDHGPAIEKRKSGEAA